MAKNQLEMFAEQEAVTAGQVMWKVGELAQFVFLVKCGNFKAYDYSTLTSFELVDGCFVGSSDAIWNGRPLQSTVLAQSPGLIFRIEQPRFREFLGNHLGLLFKLAGLQFIQ